MMEPSRPRRIAVPASFVAKLMLPFVVPIVITMAVALLIGERWPRTIAPGSGLKFAGFCATVLCCVLVWRFAIGDIADRRTHKFAALLCVATGLLGWPVWSMGMLPSVNGYRLDKEQVLTMTLERTEITRQSKSAIRNHWAWLRTDDPAASAVSGRYYIPEHVHADWTRRGTGPVRIKIARGLLGAQVVTGYE
ncbi:MAG: hypothetical protein IPM41_12090 [Sphingomonadales bacterium]|nr:hypothetical protein [Sphingomonadales bacterium]